MIAVVGMVGIAWVVAMTDPRRTFPAVLGLGLFLAAIAGLLEATHVIAPDLLVVEP